MKLQEKLPNYKCRTCGNPISLSDVRFYKGECCDCFNVSITEDVEC